MTTRNELYNKMARKLLVLVDEKLSEECDKLYRGERYQRQWAFIEIKKRFVALMDNEKVDLVFLESELNKREDSLYSYLQAERCSACGKTNCRLHCNYTGCGEPVDWFKDGYGWFGKDGKHYPMNPDSSIHLHCHLSRHRPRDYYLNVCRETIAKEEIRWRKKVDSS